MTWFDQLTGFRERSHDAVQSDLRLEEAHLVSAANDRRFTYGEFTTPSLAELRLNLESIGDQGMKIQQVVADVTSIHQNPANQDAVIQVASQFNCLEMAAPHLTPEDGVGIYQNDWTQGPACSICAGAGTIYRNYFVPCRGQIGQTSGNQIDCLHELGEALGNQDNRLWSMQNGYCLPKAGSLQEIRAHIEAANEGELKKLHGLLRIGRQFRTEVTVGDSNHLVTQLFCSALPVAYSRLSEADWEPFAQLVLDAAYEATFLAALENARLTGCRKLYLTLLGGGAFGNRLEWILAAIGRSAILFSDSDLDVSIVSYRQSNPAIDALIQAL